ncbi:hypothetical protein LLG96_08095 [bacterium]|nr:hypothetical protein [bacterium]
MVCVLEDHMQNAGHHEVTWDGVDNEGQYVASGVYMYRIEAGGRSETRKMTLIR